MLFLAGCSNSAKKETTDHLQESETTDYIQGMETTSQENNTSDGNTETVSLQNEDSENANGNTQITNQTETTVQRAVMLDHKLYLDTGEVSRLARCGVMDGSITSSVENAMPDKDGQSNFGSEYEYQYGQRENRIEVWIPEENEWIVFACNENNLDGVTMKVVENSAVSAVLEISNRVDQSDRIVEYGEEYSLEYYNPELSTWTMLYPDKEIAFNELSFSASGDGTFSTNWTVDWKDGYGELAPGTYRIVKEFKSFQESDQRTGYVLTAEFEIKV